MTQPRRHLPGQIVMLTRRTAGRQYLLRPDERINHIAHYEIARAAEPHGQLIHGAMCMSNHIHLVQTDSTGNRSDFMRDAMSKMARARNHDLNRRGYFWNNQQYGDTVLLKQEAVVRKLLYIWLNPVVAGLVRRAEEWPGFKILPRDWGKTIEIERPKGFYGRRSPEKVTFTPQPPPGFEHLSLEEAIEYFEELLREAEDEILARHRNRRFRGKRAILLKSPYDYPKTPEPMGRINPKFATKDAELMARAKGQYLEFLHRYEQSRQRWLKGRRGVTFPAGTIQMRRQAPIKCEPPDPTEPGLLGVVEAIHTSAA